MVPSKDEAFCTAAVVSAVTEAGIESTLCEIWPAYSRHLFDAKKLPYSAAQSFLAVSYLSDGALYLRQLRGGDERNDDGKLLKLELLNAAGEVIESRAEIYPDHLRLIPQTSAYAIDAGLCLSIAAGDFVAISANALGLRLSMQALNYDYVQQQVGHLQISHARQDLSIWLQQKRGELKLDAPWQGLRAEHICLDLLPGVTGLCVSMQVARRPVKSLTYLDFAEVCATNRRCFSDWLNASLKAPPELEAGRLLAAYITWSCMVPAEGQLAYPAMYMSHNWMTNIWSWDHCFNALALAKHQPEIAWQQMALIFERQDHSGRLPDFINDQFCYWRFTKPPVHGWTFSLLRQAAPEFYTEHRIKQVISWLEKLTHYWLSTYRDGLPCYDHGNDAGWDNSTVFLAGTPLQSPDLASFLILQMQELAELYNLLAQPEPAQHWQQQASELLTALIEKLWDGESFFARHAISQQKVAAGDSLILCMPLILGAQLPVQLCHSLLQQLQQSGRYLSAYGYATEALNSPYYQDDGYWRGPIWAPVCLLLYDALQRHQQVAAARQLAQVFCSMAQHSGMAENFCAKTGKALRDPAFTWTSSSFLYLANQLAEASAKPSCST